MGNDVLAANKEVATEQQYESCEVKRGVDVRESGNPAGSE